MSLGYRWQQEHLLYFRVGFGIGSVFVPALVFLVRVVRGLADRWTDEGHPLQLR